MAENAEFMTQMADVGSPVFQIGWKSAVVGVFVFVGALGGGAWLVFDTVFGDVKDDVRQIRTSFEDLTKEDTTLRGLLSGEAKDLRKEISETREAAVENRVTLGGMKENIGNLKTDMKSVKEMLHLINNKLAAAPISRDDVISYALNNKILYEVRGISDPLASRFKTKGFKIEPLGVFTASPVTASMIEDIVRAAAKMQEPK